MNKKELQKRSRTLNKSPRVVVCENFLSSSECEHIIQLASGQIDRSSVVDNNTGGSQITGVRTSYGSFLNRGHDSVVNDIEFRLAELSNTPVENGEGMQVLHYENGQEYQPHYDFFDPLYPGSEVLLQRGGQRAKTILIYLNDVLLGGETVFPLIKQESKSDSSAQPLIVTPSKGLALMFDNIDISGEPDARSLHGSKPVLEGEKWVATRWIREHMFY